MESFVPAAVSLFVVALVFARLWVVVRSARRSESHGRRLLRALVATTERETSRLSAELHDGPVQRLTALGYLLGQLEFELADSGAADHRILATDIGDQLSREIHALRHIMQGLRTPSSNLDELAALSERRAA